MLLTALVVTEHQRFFRQCESAFHARNVYVRLSPSHGGEGRKVLEATQPDILLVDVARGGGATELIGQLMEQALPRKPALFVCLDERTVDWETAYVRRGAMYVFEKSMMEHAIVECVMSIYALHRSLSGEERLKPEMVRILRECCISPRHRGYTCICDSIRLVLSQNDYNPLLTKKIYPQIAKNLETTAVRVEKNIRDAIRGGWDSGGKAIIPGLLGCGREKPPSNGEFISCVCEKLMELIYDRERPEYRTLVP